MTIIDASDFGVGINPLSVHVPYVAVVSHDDRKLVYNHLQTGLWPELAAHKCQLLRAASDLACQFASLPKINGVMTPLANALFNGVFEKLAEPVSDTCKCSDSISDAIGNDLLAIATGFDHSDKRVHRFPICSLQCYAALLPEWQGRAEYQLQLTPLTDLPGLASWVAPVCYKISEADLIAFETTYRQLGTVCPTAVETLLPASACSIISAHNRKLNELAADALTKYFNGGL